MSVWDLVQVVGIVLVVGGIGAAICGVHALRDELFRSVPLPPETMWTATVRVARRSMFWRKGSAIARSETVVVGVGIGTSSAFGTGTLGLARPADDAPREVWIRYIEDRMERSEAEQRAATAGLRKEHAAVVAQLAEDREAHAEALRAVEERTYIGLGGREGRGLVTAWWGLAATIVGTVLWGLGGLLS